jgi:hypothetical protein
MVHHLQDRAPSCASPKLPDYARGNISSDARRIAGHDRIGAVWKTVGLVIPDSSLLYMC